jgi:hypothetical protein
MIEVPPTHSYLLALFDAELPNNPMLFAILLGYTPLDVGKENSKDLTGLHKLLFNKKLYPRIRYHKLRLQQDLSDLINKV